MKYFSQTNETAMESEQMKVVLHGQVDLRTFVWSLKLWNNLPVA